MHTNRRSVRTISVALVLAFLTTLTAIASTTTPGVKAFDEVREFLGIAPTEPSMLYVRPTSEVNPVAATQFGPTAANSITSLGTAFTENFDGMGSSGTATLPAGFKIGTDWATGTTATTLAYGSTGTGVVTGTSGGGTINWANGATASATDRSLGFLTTGSFTSPRSIVMKVTNSTGSTITGIDISFDYEKTRSGTRQFDWTFFHGSTSTPSTAASAGNQSYPADANNTTISNPPTTVSKTVNLTGLSIANGSDYYFMWTFTGLAGSSNGQGIGVDNFSITASGSVAATPPTLTASGVATVDGPFDVTFTDDAAWRSAISSITVGGNALPSGAYDTTTAGKITFTPSASTLLQSAGTKAIVVIATGYTNASVSQPIGAGAPTKLGITTQPTAPVSNGAALAQQPVVAIQDQYGNVTTSTASVVANVGSGTWTLGGTTSKAGVSGSATFTDLTATSAAAVTGATIDFTSTGLTHIVSNTFNIPGPATVEPTVQASAVNFTAVGQNDLTVNWTNGNGTGRIVVAKSGSAVNADPADGNSYTANSVFGSGGTTGVSNYVVYNGTGTSVTVTGLAGNTTYYFAVYEYNGSGGTENYLAPGATGNQPTNVATYTWNQAGSAAFLTASNWTPSRTALSTSDVLQFNGGGSITATGVPTQTIGQLLVTNSTAVTLQSLTPGNTLTIGGGTGTDLVVGTSQGSTSQLNISGSNSLSIAIATGATGSVYGSMNFSGAANSLTAVDASALTFNTGSTFTQDTGSTGNVFGSTGTAGTVVFSNGSTFNQLAGSNPFGLGQPNSKVVFQTGSLFSIQQNSAPSFAGRTYANLEINAVGFSQSATGAAALSIDNLTVTTGVLNLNLTGGINIKGNIAVAPSQTLTFTPASANTITLNGTAAQSISGGGTLTFGPNATLAINNSNGITLSTDLSVSALNLTSGNITSSANTLSIASGGSVSRTSGHVIGNFKKTFTASALKTFEVGTSNGYSPVDVTATAGTFPADFTVKAIQGAMPALTGTNKLARYWALSNTTISNADLTFNYLIGDVTGTSANYKFIKNTGGALTVLEPTPTPTDTQASISGVTSFSDWTLAETSALPPPTVTSISPTSGATAGGTVVTITGTNFTGATTVSFGGTAAASFTVDSDTQITATTAGHVAGTVSVDVTTPGGTNAANTLYTYAPPPDTSAPIITYTPLTNTTSTSNPTLFPVTITDNVGVVSATLFADIGDGNNFQPNTCTLSGGTAQNGTWSCPIGGSLTSPSVVKYYITASDAVPNTATNPTGGASAPNLYAIGAATVPAGTYSNISLGNGSSIGGAVTVEGNLDLGGVVMTGANVLSLGCTATTSGGGSGTPGNYVDGNLLKTFCNTSAPSFVFPVGQGGYTPVDFNNITATAGTTLTVKSLNSRDAIYDSTKSLNRTWDITKVGSFTADVVFHYLNGDVVGNEGLYHLWKTDGGPAVDMGTGVNVTNHTLSKTGVSSFSRWTGGEPGAPTGAEVSIGGRVVTADGQGVSNARITVQGTESGGQFQSLTGPFGYFYVPGLNAGETYVVTVSSKRFTFALPNKVLTLNESADNLIFTANPNQ